MVLNVTMTMDSAPASQTLLALSVKNVLMDFTDFQNVKVVFAFNMSEINTFSSHISIKNYIFLSLQTVIVIKKDLMVLNVTLKMDSAPASQTLSVARSVINVLMDFMDFQIVTIWPLF